jgi:hypothetical protein
VDYRKFLGKVETLVLPYFGGTSVVAETRRLRVANEVSPGWWSFEVRGRVATPIEATDAPDLSHLEVARGHYVRGFLFAVGKRAERIELFSEEEPAVFAICRARRWPSGGLLFEGLEFETEAEDAARRALEERRSLADEKGMAASLRAAFAYALVVECSRNLGIAASPGEVRSSVVEISERGVPAAEALLRRLDEERLAERQRVDARLGVFRGRQQPLVPQRRSRNRATLENAAERAAEALDAAGAVLNASRQIQGGMLEVTFRFMDERFITLVDAITLQVFDAGICLSGEDRLVTLDSLPSVIKEAIETEALNITRR